MNTESNHGESVRHGQFVWLKTPGGECFVNPKFVGYVTLRYDDFLKRWEATVATTGSPEKTFQFDNEYLARRFVDLLIDDAAQ